jgi:glycosyltransferase involved in cell wall biosynthesis
MTTRLIGPWAGVGRKTTYIRSGARISLPTISVVIPCYNGATFLRATLDSVLAQTLLPVEVIVVDDGSTDESAAIADSYGSPVRVIRQPNQGESVARNRGMDEAVGEWIAFCDADDLWLPEKLAEQAQRMTGGVDAVCCGNRASYADGRETTYTPRPEYFRRGWILEHGAPCHISSCVVRRDLPARFPTWTSYSEDVVYYLDLLEHARVAIVQEPLVIYRLHAGGQTARPEMGQRRDASLRQWFAEHRDHLPPSELAELHTALQRRAKWTSLHRALAYRIENRPAAALAMYADVALRSFVTPSSMQIVYYSLRGMLGGLTETLHVRKHPVIDRHC